MAFWLDQQCLMVIIWIDVQVFCIMYGLDKMHFFVTDWIAIVVLHWLDDVHKMDLGATPIVIVLLVLMKSLWDIMMV